MKFCLLAHIAAVAVAQTDNEIYIKKSIDQIATVASPGQTKKVDINESGPLSFTTKSFHEHMETFVLVKSADGSFASPYNLIATIRTKTSVSTKVFDAEYENRIAVSGMGNSFKVIIADVSASDTNYYLVFSLTDPMDGPVRTEEDSAMYRANVYTGTVGAHYAKVGADWLMFAYQEATLSADFNAHGLSMRPATAEEKTIAGITANQAVVLNRPGADWFQIAENRNNGLLKIESPFSNTEIVRPFDETDIQSDAEPVMVGWQIDFSCGPVPPGTSDVELVAGTDGASRVVGKQPVGSIPRDNLDHLDFKSIEATFDMAYKKGGLACRFFGGDRVLGLSFPKTYSVHEMESPRPTFTAEFLGKECGLADGVEQEIAKCQVPNDQMANVFPPVYLQWEITKNDGTVFKYPDEPRKTMALPLSMTVEQEYLTKINENGQNEPVKFECVDYRESDPRTGSAPVMEGRTAPTNTADFQFRRKTESLTIHYDLMPEQMCKSDKFNADTVNEDPCSDVRKFNEPVIHMCPATKTTPMYINCTAELVNGTTIYAPFQNPDCKDVDEIDLPCLMSTMNECPPSAADPIEDGQSEAEATGSKIWLLFFVLAAVLGAILIVLNRRTKPQAEAGNAENTEKEDESLLNEPTAVAFESETAPVSSELHSEMAKDSEIPYIDAAETQSPTEKTPEKSPEKENS